MDAHKNFAVSTVATAPSPASSGASLVVAAGEGARFPAVPFNAVVCPANVLPTPANAEVVRCTARATDTLTITRAQEGSSARTIVVGDQIFAAITAKTLTDVEGAPGRQVLLNGTTTYTTPANVSVIDVTCVGSGGGGGGCSSGAGANGSGGGGGGGTSVKRIVSPGASATVAIGAGGSAGSTSGGNGGAGNDTTYATTTVVGKGGSGGQGSTGTIREGAAGGVAGTGDVNSVGGGGGPGSALFGGQGGASRYGGGSVGGGAAGSQYGGGGNGNVGNTKAGGAGAAGVMIVDEQ